MRELILLRHAETEELCSGESDRDRRLTEHGQAEAVEAGKWLADHKLAIDRVLCSPATRAQQTAKLAFPDQKITDAPEIYDATPGTLFTLIDQHQDATTLVLVGHNPGIEQFVALLVEGRSEDYRGMPPGALARLRLAKGPLEPGSATLEAFWSP
jgi:phosphohistidine phosphatase SixA